MEINTIIGIVVAVIMILLGLMMILRKPKHAEPSLDAELYIHPDSNQPIIPRHVRDQLAQLAEPTITQPIKTGSRVEPTLVPIDGVVANQTNTLDSTAVISETENVELQEKSPSSDQVHTDINAVEIKDVLLNATEPTEQIQQTLDFQTPNDPSNPAVDHTTPVEEISKSDQALSLNPNIETAEIAEFEGESNILDVHLHEQQRYDDESLLATAEQIIALNVYPNPRRALSGERVLKILLKYGLRFGEMACFHRYEKTDEPSQLMFSVLRITDNGPAGFDLETLSAEEVQGLAFFLALPNTKAVTGFDMMTSIAGLIAREIDGKVYDENNLEFSPQLKEHWRHHVIDYRPSQVTV